MKKVYSAVKIFHHKEALDVIERGGISVPFYIRLKPTNMCNHHCAYCTYGSGNTTQKTENRDCIDHRAVMPWEKMMEIIDDMGQMHVKAVTLSGGGEPLTYPHIVEAVEKIKDYGMDLSLISNGELLDEKRAELFYDAKWVRISFDSPDAGEYAALRGISVKSYEKVIQNIAGFAKNKNKNCVLGVNFTIGRYNSKRVYEAAGLLKSLGVDNIKYSAVVDNRQHYHDEIKDGVIAQIHKAKQNLESDSFQIINQYEKDWMDKNFSTQPFPVCYTCRFVTVIGADQKVYLCHTKAYDSNAVVADLKEQSFRQAWYSDEVRARLCNVKPETECRNFCAYQERNELIQSYFDVNYDHVNFI